MILFKPEYNATDKIMSKAFIMYSGCSCRKAASSYGWELIEKLYWEYWNF